MRLEIIKAYKRLLTIHKTAKDKRIHRFFMKIVIIFNKFDEDRTKNVESISSIVNFTDLEQSTLEILDL